VIATECQWRGSSGSSTDKWEDDEYFDINRVTRRWKAERATVLYGRLTLTEHEIGQCSRCGAIKTVVSRANGLTVGRQSDHHRVTSRTKLHTRRAAGHDALCASMMITAYNKNNYNTTRRHQPIRHLCNPSSLQERVYIVQDKDTYPRYQRLEALQLLEGLQSSEMIVIRHHHVYEAVVLCKHITNIFIHQQW